MMLDLVLVFSLGFLGSFGHCVGMCGPLAAAFALATTQEPGARSQEPGAKQPRSQEDKEPGARSQKPGEQEIQGAEARSREPRSQGVEGAGVGSQGRVMPAIAFHTLLNLGRLLSYTLVGAGIGGLGSVLLAGGQVAGIGSPLRRGLAIATGLLLIWFGLVQVSPGLLPRLPFLHPLLKDNLHHRLGNAMMRLSERANFLTPLLLGSVWGLIPCGFLYAAQLKAAETGSLQQGALTMLAFGLGTLPTMLGVGVLMGTMGSDRRSQLFRMGGWVTLTIGVLTLLRTGDTMTDYTGYGAILCLMLALVARPLSRLWAGLLKVRRALGVGAFVLTVAHVLHTVAHTWDWNWQAFFFLPLQLRWGVGLGAIALLLMAPAALTSFDRAQQRLGKAWRSLHLLAVPALLLGALHSILTGANFLGNLQLGLSNWVLTGLLGLSVVGVLGVRSPLFWKWFSLEEKYVPPIQK